jgi:hypothetical protein
MGGEDREVDDREDLADDEVHGVAQRLRACAIGGDDGAEQERQIHPRQPQFAGAAQGGREDQHPRKAAGDRAQTFMSAARRAPRRPR